MPNTANARGLVARMHAKGGIARLNPIAYQIAGGLASNIYRGSAVKPVGTDKRIDAAAAGDRLIGVFNGAVFTDATGNVQFAKYWPSGQTILAGTIAEASVFDDPDILFSVQVSGAPGLAAADVGATADLVIAAGNAATGYSGDQLDQATITSVVATGGQLRIEALDPDINNGYGQYAKALVRIAEHFLSSSTTAGQGVMAI